MSVGNRRRGPPLVTAGHRRGRSNDRQANIDIATGGVGIGADLVSLGDERLGLCAGNAGQGHGEVDVQAEAAGRARSDTDGRGYGGVGRYFRAALRSHELHRPNEASRITGSKELFGIVAGSPAAAQFLWRGEFDVERAI